MNLLITAAGTGTAFSYALAKNKYFNDITLLMTDTNPKELVTSSLFCNKFIQFPAFSSPKFKETLYQELKSNNVNYYLPIIDGEILLASTDEYIDKSILAINNKAFCSFAIQKNLYGSIVKNIDGVSTPKIYTLSELDSIKNEKVIIKDNGGFGSRNTKILLASDINMDQQLLEDNFFIYEYIEGSEFTVDCFPHDSGCHTSVRQRIEVKNGVCTKTKICLNKALSNLADFLTKQFNLIQPFCFQTRYRDGVHYLIDLNPRLGAGSALSAQNGMDFFAAHLALLTGNNPNIYLNHRYQECVVTRQYTEYLMEFKK